MVEDTKKAIGSALSGFGSGSLGADARQLFDALGYRSDKVIALDAPDYASFQPDFDPQGQLNQADALVADWRTVDFIFQLTDDELAAVSPQMTMFESAKTVDNARIQSYLVFAIELARPSYTRTQLARATRALNKLFPMPALVLFKHGPALTLAIIDRRLNKVDADKDVLEKVTLIKDIACAQPHRAHVEILYDLALPQLQARHAPTNFVELHRAWQQTLDTSELNRRFFKEIANWYFWAVKTVRFPTGSVPHGSVPQDAGPETRNAASVIRMITRLIFVWFVKEKGLIPAALFDRRQLQDVLTWADPADSTYYKAILQNLFFATLNQEMNSAEKPHARDWRKDGQHYNVTNLYRYRRYFRDANGALALFASIPFLNGGLFECLDKPERHATSKPLRIDGFSDRDDNELRVPDELFFGDTRYLDLNEVYGTSNKQYPARGLFRIFEGYKFTVDENTPVEEEIALDPELLGRVFENLLAAYNPETGVTARKQTGSFYTPREIVSYMVDESLLAYLGEKLPAGENADHEPRLRALLGYNTTPHRFSPAEVKALIDAIDRVKILDPACGSGAFPMGVLHKLVYLLARLDPGNAAWKRKQIEKAEAIDEPGAREKAVADIEQAFERNELDYGRKLYLIENCIYGVDIQPIAVQIAKLRFFISLVVDQCVDDAQPNRGIRPLPNLETKFVAANTLLGIDRPQQLGLRNPAIDDKEAELARVRDRYFTARTPGTKNKYREQDKALRAEIAALLKQDGFERATTEKLAYWDPYDQNASASFFDPEWMFGVSDGFDITIGNPPYVRQEQLTAFKPAFQKQYACYTGTADLYVYFYERGLQLLRAGGLLCYISSNKYFRAGYGAKLRGYLAGEMRIRQLIDFGDAPVFTAIAYPSIVLVEKAKPREEQVRALTWESGQEVETFPAVFRQSSFLIAQRELTADGWQLQTPSVLRLVEKLRRTGQALGEYTQGRFYRGVLTGLNEAFIVDDATRTHLIAQHPSSAGLLHPFLRGRDVKRWGVQFADRYLIRIESSENKTHPWSNAGKGAEDVFASTYPAIYRHLSQHRAALIQREDQGRYFWELRSCQYWQAFLQPKIIYPDIAQRPEFAFDRDGYYAVNTLYILPTQENWLLSILNSSLIFWYYTKLSSQIRGGFVRFIAQYVSQIPIQAAGAGKSLQGLTDQILGVKTEGQTSNVEALEAAIDEQVYALYGLTRDEIRIIQDK